MVGNKPGESPGCAGGYVVLSGRLSDVRGFNDFLSDFNTQVMLGCLVGWLVGWLAGCMGVLKFVGWHVWALWCSTQVLRLYLLSLLTECLRQIPFSQAGKHLPTPLCLRLCATRCGRCLPGGLLRPLALVLLLLVAQLHQQQLLPAPAATPRVCSWCVCATSHLWSSWPSR